MVDKTDYADDFYAILRCTPDDDVSVLKRGWTFRRAQLNPRINRRPPDLAATAEAQAVNRAWETLSDPVRRAHYDRWYRAFGPDAAAEQRAGPAPPEPTPPQRPAAPTATTAETPHPLFPTLLLAAIRRAVLRLRARFARLGAAVTAVARAPFRTAARTTRRMSVSLEATYIVIVVVLGVIAALATLLATRSGDSGTYTPAAPAGTLASIATPYAEQSPTPPSETGAVICSTGTHASTLLSYGFPCPDSVVVEKSGPLVTYNNLAPGADIWTVTIRYHWVGDPSPLGQQAQLRFSPTWPAGCLQSDQEVPIVVLAMSATIKTHYALGRANEKCGPGSYTTGTYTLDFVAFPRAFEPLAEPSVLRYWSVTGSQPAITMTVR